MTIKDLNWTTKHNPPPKGVAKPPRAKKYLGIWPRANPKDMKGFDPRSKVCTMSCGPSADDPRSYVERKFLCTECYVRPGYGLKLDKQEG